MSDTTKTMVLITTPWRDGAKSFSLVPISQECPYAEAFYDPDRKLFVIMGKEIKDSLHMVAKLDDNGDPEMAKKPRPRGQAIREERRVLPTNREYIIIEKDEIVEMIERLATNADKFDYKKYLDGSAIFVPETPSIILQS